MKVRGKSYRTLWVGSDGWSVEIIDQTLLPSEFQVLRLTTCAEVAHAIRGMQLRGAPLIGVAAAYGICLAVREDPSDSSLAGTRDSLLATRPTAVNLRWALEQMETVLRPLAPDARQAVAYRTANELADADVAICERIGYFGEPLLRDAFERKGRSGPVQILTHCNAGWLATIDWGTALAPIYRAHDAGLPLHVWVDETRPRNQGYLTAWELAQHGVPYTVIVDNAGGLLMQQGKVDLCLVGTDRTTRSGNVANKIGTYLKALAAKDCGVPFYAAVPSPSLDWSVRDASEIPIEERDAREVHGYAGMPARNPAFDVTPAHLVTGLITERGVCAATEEGLLGLFPENR